MNDNYNFNDNSLVPNISDLATVGITSLRFNRLILTLAGTYNQMYNRPFELDVSGMSLNSLGNVIENSINGSGYKSNIDPVDIAKSVPSMLRPSTVPTSEVNIQNGWNEERYRYILEVEVEIRGSHIVYFLQGYTEFSDPTYSGLIDPHMSFYINSIVSVTRTYLPNGQIRDIIHENDNILFREDNQDPVGAPNSNYTIRPNDIFTGLESSYVGANISDNYMVGDDSIVDTRCILRNNPKPSNRGNLLPSNYLASVINAQTVSQNIMDIGASSEDMMAKAKSITGETNLATNPFIRLLAMNRRQVVVNTFTVNDLAEIDESIKSVINVVAHSNNGAQMLHRESMSEYMDGSNIETIIATIIGNSIPAIMSKYLLGNIELTSTNKTIDGRPATMVGRAMSLINADVTEYVNRFISAFELETMNEISNGNILQVEVSVKADLYRDVLISVSVNDGPYIDYAIPVFCDSLISPVVADNANTYFGLVDGFDSLLGTLS